MSSIIDNNASIFIHAWWRSSSTYIWAKLRESANLRCYYEPLHEQVYTLSEDFIRSSNSHEINKVLRHPELNKNYFFEYLDLLVNKELNFSKDLSYERYYLNIDQEDKSLSDYIRRLVSSANFSDKKAVLCFCRSQMRSAWIKKNFGGIHIAQIRNPYDQWNSFKTNQYFVRGLITIFLQLKETYSTFLPNIKSFDSKLNNLAFDESELFLIFMAIWYPSTIQALSIADYVIDVDRLSVELPYRIQTSDFFRSIGIDVDFSDCQTPFKNNASDCSTQISFAELGSSAIPNNSPFLMDLDRELFINNLRYLSFGNKKLLETIF